MVLFWYFDSLSQEDDIFLTAEFRLKAYLAVNSIIRLWLRLLEDIGHETKAKIPSSSWTNVSRGSGDVLLFAEWSNVFNRLSAMYFMPIDISDNEKYMFTLKYFFDKKGHRNGRSPHITWPLPPTRGFASHNNEPKWLTLLEKKSQWYFDCYRMSGPIHYKPNVLSNILRLTGSFAVQKMLNYG